MTATSTSPIAIAAFDALLQLLVDEEWELVERGENMGNPYVTITRVVNTHAWGDDLQIDIELLGGGKILAESDESSSRFFHLMSDDLPARITGWAVKDFLRYHR